MMKQHRSQQPVYRTLLSHLRKIGLATIYIYIIGVLSWNLLKVYPGDSWLPVRLGSFAAPWLLMSLIPILAIVLLVWSRRRWLMALTLAALMFMAGRHWHLLKLRPLSASARTDTVEQLRLMTYNVHYANRNVEDVVELIDAEAPDLIAMQELMEPFARLLRPELAAAYPYQLVDPSGVALFSRYPLKLKLKNETLFPADARVQQAVLRLPDRTVTVWNVHPRPTLKPGRWLLQQEILAAVAGAVAADDGPVIVLGDFNATEQIETYQLVADQLTDVHTAVGQGFGFTYPEPDVLHKLLPLPWDMQLWLTTTPVIRIDHIFVSNHFSPQATHVVPDGAGSDHRPVVAAVQLNGR